MITCEIWGAVPGVNNGLGNQMFCVAATAALAQRNNDTAVFELNSPQEPYKTNIFRNLKWEKLNDTVVYKEGSLNFYYKELPYLNNLQLKGYFQSEKYFVDQREFILELFSANEDILEYINQKYSDHLKNSVSIHVRRGDYLLAPNYHPECTMEYYEKSMDLFSNQGYKFLVFSDDIEWCKTQFEKYQNCYFVEKEKDYIDLFLMSMCEHNITANSSFSWWGAWLNKNKEKKVVAPKIWFGPKYANSAVTCKDLIPKNWLRI